jgi:hypothetical protein
MGRFGREMGGALPTRQQLRPSNSSQSETRGSMNCREQIRLDQPEVFGITREILNGEFGVNVILTGCPAVTPTIIQHMTPVVFLSLFE